LASLFGSMLLAPLVPAWGQADPDARMRAVEAQLDRGEWEPALRAAQALTADLARQSGGTRGDHRATADELGGAMADASPPAEGLVLGRAAALQALAEAALGRRDEARWHWYVAQNLDRRLIHMKLAHWGEAGAFLGRHRLAQAATQLAALTDVLDPVRPEAAGSGFREPERTEVVYPPRPEDLRDRDRFSHVVFVQITVAADGEVVQPVVVDAAFYPGLVYRAFEALRQWRYRPATLDGAPIPFRYVVPVPFADDRPPLSTLSSAAPRPQ
jgi:hypothetical protein